MNAPEIARLPIHFDVPANYLTAADYLVAVKSFSTTLTEFNRRIFDGNIEYEFLVLPAEDGSFKGVTGVIVKSAKGAAKTALAVGAVGGLIGLADSSILNDMAKEWTGKTIQELHIGTELAVFLRDMTKGFFITESDRLEQLIPKNLNLDKALLAKSEFYKMCVDNREISAVGFDDTENFPIKRTSFSQHITKEKIRPVPSEFILYRNAIIVSPIDIDIDRVWRLQDSTTKQIINAYMRDDAFKSGFLSGKYPLKESSKDDRMTVLIEYQRHEKNGEVESKEISINTVYSFNDIEITPIPTSGTDSIKFSRADILPMDKLWNNQ